ncbi:nitrate/nitrite transporter NarK [Roseibium hamelinense]|uniref:Nitrate/nitrite transporter NarK n=1 Tax=Roseibium hamelinense TaxID=150831 RepID=A0A562T9K6_9HYPH|nr:MFS transporter [Roseibium hamelinense]MTI45280.1 MFS transporter [Roseibium hamelinense]TWI90357.1 nitrate/nitrite transporter NarK [Roseibium hamelinense]
MTYFTKNVAPGEATGWRSPAVLLMIMAGAMQLSFAAWWNLMNNFAVQELDFTGREIGIQQSIREIPGFLSFAAIYLLLLMREQTLAYLSLAFLGVGVAITGYFPTAWGFYITTLIMSVGFHYYETMAQSLSLQWLPKATAAASMGKIIAVGAFAQLIAYGLIFIGWKTLDLSFTTVFTVAGGLTLVVLAFLMMSFPHFKEGVPQRKKLFLRKRYWLYYALTFMAGARRQIFTVFAGFLMVERFGYDVHEVAALFLLNGAFNMLLAPKIGKLIVRFGERKALILEYVGLIGVFCTYAFVTDPNLAAALYVIDHAFFAIAIAIKTYFQKIADPADIAPTAGVAFTINHIAAVFIPVIFGVIWLYSPAAVFLAGAGMAFVSLVLASLIPSNPDEGNEVDFWFRKPVAQPAE